MVFLFKKCMLTVFVGHQEGVVEKSTFGRRANAKGQRTGFEIQEEKGRA